MRRFVGLLVAAGLVVGVVVSVGVYRRQVGVTPAEAKDGPSTPAAPKAAPPSASAAAKGAAPQAQVSKEEAEGPVVYTFKDDDEVKEFAKLWQRRQGVIVKMTVLQSYWNEEQATLAQLNSQIEKDYKLDVSKNYTFDSDRRVLIERPGTPEPEQGQPPSPPSSPSQTP